MKNTKITNARMLPAKAAAEILNSKAPCRFAVLDDKIVAMSVCYDAPCPVAGEEFSVIGLVGGCDFLCVRNEDLAALGDAWQA